MIKVEETAKTNLFEKTVTLQDKIDEKDKALEYILGQIK